MARANDTSVAARIETRNLIDRTRDSGSIVVESTGKGRDHNPLLRISIRGPGGEGEVHAFARDLEEAIKAAKHGGR